MNPWLEVCRAAARDVTRVLEELPSRVEREPVLRAGLGGDDTTAVDDAAERAVLAQLERFHGQGHDFVLVSEELGERTFGRAPRTRVVVDPIDGSNNAKRGIRFFCLAIAVAEGETMDDVVFGFVHDFGTGEEWTATRGAGALLDGSPLAGTKPKDPIEILCFEATETQTIAEKAASMVGIALRLRVMGSLALSLCHLADGRLDGVCSLKSARSVDIAAAQLLVREMGLAIDLPEAPPFGAAQLDLEARSRVVAAGTPALCRELAAALV